MRAFQLIEPQSAEIRDVEQPEPGPGEVLLQVTGAGVCHSDLHILHAPAWPGQLPMTFGHEIAGTVVATGPETTGWEPGQSALVYICWGCGSCRMCAAGFENSCERYPRQTPPGPGLGRDGGMADYVRVPARHLVALGDLDPVAAAPLTDAALTPYHAISLVRDRLSADATVVAVGIGGLGHMGVQLLRATTGATIVAVDTDEARLAQATELGADRVVQAGPAAAEEIVALTGGRGADVVLDFVGAQPTLELAAATIGSRGRIVAVGLAGGSIPFAASGFPAGLPWGASIVRPYAGTRRDLQEVVALARQGRIDVHVTRFPLEEARAVLDSLEAGEIPGRAVLVPGSAPR
jgi:propanol-preferring alcohol dehydrogenase